MTNTKTTATEPTTPTRDAILAELSGLDRGDGCLGITIDQCLADGIDDVATIRAIVLEAEEEAAAERVTHTIQCRHSSGSSCWEPEPECVGLSREESERVLATLEPTDEDGNALEYRIVEESPHAHRPLDLSIACTDGPHPAD